MLYTEMRPFWQLVFIGYPKHFSLSFKVAPLRTGFKAYGREAPGVNQILTGIGLWAIVPHLAVP
jgi:hypothetical protein